ncbi:type I restriction endonuclease subunit R [Gemmatimonas sp. UBA7669]|uniref:type I restriction endonuclease subunit R n=1 Tax=Gemmatimonas sp. UBA7669 TaxID=1946568 RepID=UPI0025BDDC6D|nr:type I restriction endonuclease subunit R [Gemmatimonas sp. UBA7669]
MSQHRGTETDFERTTIERLEQVGYTHLWGLELDRPPEQVVLRDILRGNLARRYSDLPGGALDEAVARLARPDGVDTIRRNLAFHRDLMKGLELPVEYPDGRRESVYVWGIDWERPEANDFQVVNQLPVRGQNDRRPDIVLYVNGLPLVVLELKNPWAEAPTVEHAWTQVQHYTHDIPQLFDFNALCVVSDGVTSLHGQWPAGMEWYAPWKSIDGVDVEPGTTATMKTLVEGLLTPQRLLRYVRDFVLFEIANEQITKKGAKYHQFFAVQAAAERAIAAVRPGADRRLGVVWHTTGSGKSLTMAFLVGMLRRAPELANPTFVIQVDRTDLDNQLYDQFVLVRDLVGDVNHAGSVGRLRELLTGEAGEVVFTTTAKFQLDDGEMEHPVLSTRQNVIVIADEAHRSQYGFAGGFARYLREALPNARFIGFTGTPVSFAGADTVAVFGNLIHTYDIRQSQEDQATVPIFYAPRQIKLHLSRTDLDEALEDIVEGEPQDELERRKSKWAALAAAAGARDRVKSLASDLLAHYRERTATLAGKAMVVCMTRENCVRLYDALTALPGCPEVQIVMTGDITRDPPEWSEAGHLTTKKQREALKKRFKDPDDPLAMVIVCDMWLTGTDIPCLHTLYVDKPMRGHTIIQAISRVNRVFRDKPHGLVVDYIGIGDDLREATSTYTAGGGRGEPAPDVSSEAVPLFQAALAALRETLPPGPDYGAWRRLSGIALEDLYALVYGTLADNDARRDAFLDAEQRLTHAFLLVKHLDECRPHADEVIYAQRVRKQLRKALPGRVPSRDIERAVRDLVDDSVDAAGVVDIFRAAGIELADISILDDRFLQTFKEHPRENLRLRLLEKLLRDELDRRRSRNLTKDRSFRELLEKTIQQYHNRLVDAAAVIKAMLEIKKELDADEARAAALGLEPEEVAFYDALATNMESAYEPGFLRDLVHDVVQTVKARLKVEWTQPHRDQVKADVRAAVKRVLNRRRVRAEDLDVLLDAVMKQAEAMYKDWPMAA